MRLMGLTGLFFATVLPGQVPSGWKVVHDKGNACQMGVPADWKVDDQMAGMAYAPSNQGDASLQFQAGKDVKPMSEMAQKALSIDKMIDNTPQKVLFSNPPTKSAQPITPYHARVQGKGGACVALFSARPGVTEDTVKKIVATIGPAK